jgi:hypothetical protein
MFVINNGLWYASVFITVSAFHLSLIFVDRALVEATAVLDFNGRLLALPPDNRLGWT